MIAVNCAESPTVQVENLEFRLKEAPPEWAPRIDRRRIEPGLDLLTISLERPDAAYPPEFRLEWEFPIVDVIGAWTATAHKEKNLEPDWGYPFTSQLGVGAPVFTLFGSGSENRLTCAASDALNLLEFRKGVNEESARLYCRIEFLKGVRTKLRGYAVEIRIDRRRLPFSQALEETAAWWNRFYPAAPVPAGAWEPVYSSWYAFHQELQADEVERQCRMARELGCATLIVDDGWQTADNRRGYAYCGDWELCGERFPDMAAHVERVHALGMKYLLWYSVPFVGIRSRAYWKFQEYFLYLNEGLEAAVLDPRFPEVRRYLIKVYTDALKRWKLDGFKLDFIDSFALPPGKEDPARSNPGGRDIASLPEAVNRLMLDLRRELGAISPDVLIEFRQNYTGPAMLQYGNLFRAADCPNDLLSNRIRIVDIRLSVPGGAVHSDMLMWNGTESVEAAARQLLNTIFAVPQLSVRLDTIPDSHRAMLKFYLAYQRKHRDVFLYGKIRPEAPELNYPIVAGESSTKRAAAVYHPLAAVATRLEPGQLFIAINATAEPRLLLCFDRPYSDVAVRIFDATGKCVEEDQRTFADGPAFIPVPPSGVLEITLPERKRAW